MPKNYSVSGNLLGFFLSKSFLRLDFYSYFYSQAVVCFECYFFAGGGLLLLSFRMKSGSSSAYLVELEI